MSESYALRSACSVLVMIQSSVGWDNIEVLVGAMLF